MTPNKIILELYELVETACKSPNNKFGYGAWTHHILSVIKYSKLLGKQLNADLEILEISALLHDYSGILNYENYSDHHKHSAKLAETILKNYNYPQEKISQIQHCILCHRASKKIKKTTTEAEILANADALAHFDNFNSLLYLAFIHKNKNIEEGTTWALKKLERS